MSNILDRRTSLSSPTLTQGQLDLDLNLHSFTEQASNPVFLASMAVGSFAFRFTKLLSMEGAAATGLSKLLPKFAMNVAASAMGLGAEVTAFRGANNLFKGESLKDVFDSKGWFGTATDFSALKLLSPLGIHNPLLAHFAQSNAMVLGHELSATLGFANHEKGSYIQRLAQAEVANIAMSAGAKLFAMATGNRLQMQEQILAA